jgi:hypothetical protein
MRLPSTAPASRSWRMRGIEPDRKAGLRGPVAEVAG